MLATELRPDVVVMDVAMPNLNRIEATRQIKTELPEVEVVVLSMHATRNSRPTSSPGRRVRLCIEGFHV